MSCFVVPLVQAMATSICRKHIEKNNANGSLWQAQLPTLEKMLWGGTLVLVVDHIASGELSFIYPFLTELSKTGGLEKVLGEMLTTGLPMSLVITAVWAIVVMRKSHALKSQRIR